MDKLIELLNEFYKEEGDIFRAIQHNDRLKIFELENDDLVRDSAIISKHYGFIERLVKNDKINLKYVTNYSIYGTDEYFEPYENLIMDLARVDNPIEYLCGLLK